MKKLLSLLVLVIGILGQDLVSPVHLHMPALAKILKKDKNVSNNKDYTLAIVYMEDEEESIENKDGIVLWLLRNKEKYNINAKPIPFKSKSQLYASVDNSRANALYICSDVNDDVLKKILFVTKKLNVMSVTGSEDYFEEGVSFAIKMNNDTPEIIYSKESLASERPHLKEFLKTGFASGLTSIEKF